MRWVRRFRSYDTTFEGRAGTLRLHFDAMDRAEPVTVWWTVASGAAARITFPNGDPGWFSGRLTVPGGGDGEFIGRLSDEEELDRLEPLPSWATAYRGYDAGFFDRILTVGVDDGTSEPLAAVGWTDVTRLHTSLEMTADGFTGSRGHGAYRGERVTGGFTSLETVRCADPVALAARLLGPAGPGRRDVEAGMVALPDGPFRFADPAEGDATPNGLPPGRYPLVLRLTGETRPSVTRAVLIGDPAAIEAGGLSESGGHHVGVPSGLVEAGPPWYIPEGFRRDMAALAATPGAYAAGWERSPEDAYFDVSAVYFRTVSSQDGRVTEFRGHGPRLAAVVGDFGGGA